MKAVRDICQPHRLIADTSVDADVDAVQLKWPRGQQKLEVDIRQVR